MKHRVIGRVAHIHTDATIGLDENQYSRRAHQLAPIGEGRFRVTGPHVSFKYGEVIDIIDGAVKSAVLEAVGNAKSPAGIPNEMRAEADTLKIRYGFGIGPKLLAAKIEMAKAERERIASAANADATKEKAKAASARRKAAKARK